MQHKKFRNGRHPRSFTYSRGTIGANNLNFLKTDHKYFKTAREKKTLIVYINRQKRCQIYVLPGEIIISQLHSTVRS